MKKFLFIPISALLLTSCGGSKSDTPAQRLYAEAEQAFGSDNYAQATLLLDSLAKAYPTEVALQRQAMALRPKVIEKETMMRIVTIDSLEAVAQATAEQLKPQMRWVKTPRMVEGYWVASEAYNADFLNTTGLQGRVNEIGQFYIISSLQGGNLRHTSVSLTTDKGTAATVSVPYDGESNYRIGGSEVITFSPEQSDTIGELASRSAGIATLTFHGPKATKKVKLTAKQLSGLSLAYRYSQAVIGARQDAVERQRLDKQLQIARDQQARTSALLEN